MPQKAIIIALLSALIATLASVIGYLTGQGINILSGIAAFASIITLSSISLSLWARTRTSISSKLDPARNSVSRREIAELSKVDLPMDTLSEAHPEILYPGEVTPPGQDFIANQPWIALIERCVGLFDELDRLNPRLDAPRREIADQVLERLQEILEASGVRTIQGDTNFDRSLHELVAASGAVNAGATIIETVSPGYAVDRRVLRRARVRIAT